MDNSLYGPIALNDLLQSKALAPLTPQSLQSLETVVNLDVTDFSEAEVRAYVIDPIVRILGYEKGSIFSVDLEKKIDFLKADKFIDYKMTLWKENFWIIEAKKPKSGRAFSYRDLAQALEYAIHPEVNAALVVLCDGRKIEVFDREASLTEPLVRILIKDLKADFDKLRILLEPWQIWFFQKRRIVRLLDKVFDKEINLDRVKEFKSLIERRLDSKRSVILDNFRSQISSDDASEQMNDAISKSNYLELIDVHFFLRYSARTNQVITDTLLRHSGRQSFPVLYRMFPDHPRDANDTYYMHALQFLMAMDAAGRTVDWLPGWLSAGGPDLKIAIKQLIKHTLSYFADDPARKTVLLAASAFRRVWKLSTVANERQWRLGELLHAVERYTAPELSWRQIVTSPARQIALKLDEVEIQAISQFVMENRNDRGEFRDLSAKAKLKELWELEKTLLSSTQNYGKLVVERGIDETHPTEAASVGYDHLGHSCLCGIEAYPAWKEYALAHHLGDIQKLAAIGSWQAKKWLGMDIETSLTRPSDKEFADRFFFGDDRTFKALLHGYGFK